MLVQRTLKKKKKKKNVSELTAGRAAEVAAVGVGVRELVAQRDAAAEVAAQEARPAALGEESRGREKCEYGSGTSAPHIK